MPGLDCKFVNLVRVSTRELSGDNDCHVNIVGARVGGICDFGNVERG